MSEETFIRRFGKLFLVYAMVAVPVVVVVLVSGWLGRSVADWTGVDWLKAPVAIAVLVTIMASVQAAWRES